MARTQNNHATPVPFLVKYASERTSSSELQGYYSAQLAMWVVTDNGYESALIDHKNAEVELTTKTAAQPETDDEGDMLAMAELLTKTDAQAEQDETSANACLEMATKTGAKLEHDDTSHEVSGMFL